jgi:hypothetical protein
MPERPSIARLEGPEETDFEAAHSFLSVALAPSELDRIDQDARVPGRLLWITSAA